MPTKTTSVLANGASMGTKIVQAGQNGPSKATRFGRVPALAACLLFTVGAVRAQCLNPVQTARLTPTDAMPGDRMGEVLSATDEMFAVGVGGDDTVGGENAGSVVVFQRTNGQWVFHSRLTASDGRAGDLFGNAVAMTESVLVVGAYDADGPNGTTDVGKAYVFELENNVWVEKAILTAEDPATNSFTGKAVAVSGTTVMMHENINTVAVFDRIGGVWTRTQTLAPSNTIFFGDSIVVRGETAAIGDPAGDTRPGSVLVYIRQNGQWVLQHRFMGPEVANGNYFGGRVDLDGNTLVVGQVKGCTNCESIGKAFVYTRSTYEGPWSLEAVLSMPETQNRDLFGEFVAIRGDLAVVSARLRNDPPGNESGVARVFQRSGGLWNYCAALTPTPHAAGDRFGGALALVGRVAIVGASQFSAPPAEGYMTVIAITPCPPDFNCDGFLDFFDYDAFVECFETEVCGANTADFNADGFVDFFDYDAFVAAFEAGC
ncbi:MAG: hypothetical protein HEQ23_04435 [Tepidisphaera sp.]